jgi:uncharacterized protein
MHFEQVLGDIGYVKILAVLLLTFVAGFLDAVVGGGGLITVPALLINLPKIPIATLFGTNKIAALSGTSVAAFQYAKRIKFNSKLLFVIAFFSSVASFTGARLVTYINVNTFKPVILVILVLITVYTVIKKDLGSIQTKSYTIKTQMLFGSLIGLVVGFYDGFFGPGTGSFLILGFVVLLGFEFIHASAYAKVINCFTNLSALIVFIKQGNYILELAIPMAVLNIAGNILGTRMALKKGNKFVRIVFLIIVSLMILRYGYDVFFAKV